MHKGEILKYIDPEHIKKYSLVQFARVQRLIWLPWRTGLESKFRVF